MSMYALVNNENGVLRRQIFDDPPPVLAPEKGLRWLPAVEIGVDLEFDPSIQNREATETVTANSVERQWIVRTKTPDECLANCRAARRNAYPPLHEQIEAITEHVAGRKN